MAPGGMAAMGAAMGVVPAVSAAMSVAMDEAPAVLVAPAPGEITRRTILNAIS